MLDNALRCLKNVTFDETSLYVKALMAYVFTLTEDVEMRQELLSHLHILRQCEYVSHQGLDIKAGLIKCNILKTT